MVVLASVYAGSGLSPSVTPAVCLFFQQDRLAVELLHGRRLFDRHQGKCERESILLTVCMTGRLDLRGSVHARGLMLANGDSPVVAAHAISGS